MRKDDRRLVKLVRDDVERFCGGDQAVRYERIDDDEFIEALRKKLGEETTEYLLNPCLEELADVWEAVRALVKHDLKVSLVRLFDEARRKRRYKGGFDGRLGMYLHVAPEHRDAA